MLAFDCHVACALGGLSGGGDAWIRSLVGVPLDQNRPLRFQYHLLPRHHGSEHSLPGYNSHTQQTIDEIEYIQRTAIDVLNIYIN
mmetsp:Transcript_12445/g.34546  ORF Transcript_12445/g.34546 Transcript_12445/m.34546 type:complete len:85 (+) Transcript_12445:1303-1557(+)